MTPIKLIAVDIGGTLINDNNNISNENIETFKELNRRGVKICLTTARMYSSTKYISNLIMSDYGVFGNGSIVMALNNKKIISSSVLDYDDKKKLMVFGKLNNLYIHFSQFFYEGSDQKEYFLLKHSLLNEHYDDKYKSNLKCVDDLYEYVLNSDDIVNMVFVSENNMDDLYQKLREQEPNICITEYYRNCRETAINKIINYIEVSKLKTDKSIGLKKLINHLGLTKNEVLVIGDGNNDLDMFKEFPNSGCLKNGSEKAKQYAKYISLKTNNESGVSEIIKYYMEKGNIL